jgi:hypothetical protein
MALGFNNGVPQESDVTKFTSYSQRKKRASTHWVGMTLILDAFYGLGIINIYDRK